MRLAGVGTMEMFHVKQFSRNGAIEPAYATFCEMFHVKHFEKMAQPLLATRLAAAAEIPVLIAGIMYICTLLFWPWIPQQMGRNASDQIMNPRIAWKVPRS